MRVVIDHVIPQRATHECALRKELGGVAQIVRHARQRLRLVDIACKNCRWLSLVADAVQPGSERGGVGEIRIAVGSRNARLNAQGGAMTHHAKARGAVVVAPRDARGRP